MERRLFLLLFRAYRALSAYGNAQTHAALGVSTSQLATLQHVSKRPGCSLSDLASVLDMNKSAVTGLVQRMERDGILRRMPDPDDRRASLLYVTPKGDDVRARSAALIRRLTTELTDGFDTHEVETVVRFLNALVERCTSSTTSDGSSSPTE